MPCLNAEVTIGEAIQSVLSQDYVNFEIIIVDDGSTDESITIINHFQSSDSRVKFIRNKGVHGVSSARNMGIDAASGKYICFLDADDYLLPGSIAARVNKLRLENAKIVFGPYLRLMPSGDLMKKHVPSHVSLSQMLMRNYIGNLTGMYDAGYLGKIRQQSIKHEDYLMWCQLLGVVKHAHSTGEEPIAVYRVSPNSLSGNKLKASVWHWIVLRRGLGVGLFSSIYYQLFYIFSSLIERFFQAFQGKLK